MLRIDEEMNPEPFPLFLNPQRGFDLNLWDIFLLTERREDAISDLRERERCNT